jgi:translocation protein SEC66
MLTFTNEQANAYAPNWGQVIFQSANEMVNNEIVRERLEKHQKKLDEEKAWWEKKKASIQEGFMKELDAEKPGTVTTAAATAAPEVAEGTQVAVGPKASAAPPASTVTESDDDAVLVEADEQAGSAGQKSPGGGKKKKKGKK